MKEIQLSQGKTALVDDEDFEWLNQWNWYLSGMGYAVRGTKTNKKKTTIWMHREIINCPDDKFTDHINGNILDNRKSNLRIVTHAQNMRNRKIQKNNKSGFRGVHQKKDGYWYAQIKINGIQRYLGHYKTPEEASIVYEKEAEKKYGEFRRR